MFDRPSFRSCRVTLTVMLCAACGGGSTIIEPPPPPPPASFKVVLAPDPEDGTTAQALGWAARIPDADVILTPTAGSAAPRTARSTATGTADFGNVPSGSYYVEAYRWLTPSEAATLPVALGVDGWAARKQIAVPINGGTETVAVPTSRRQSLVISEWAFNDGYDPVSQSDYPWGGFLELYNNSDTTIYLDGLIVGEGFSLAYNYPNFPCSLYTGIALDPLGIWSRYFQAFPGTGHDFPLVAGRTVVIATDAIDHRPFFPGALDLSHADFEFRGRADVDNPAVPNMVDIGIQPDANGHGIIFEHGLAEVPYIALTVPVPSLLLQPTPAGSGNWGRIPADRILDVFAIAPTWTGATSPACPSMITPNFDRAPSLARDGSNDFRETLYSLNRRVAFVLPNGQRVLQHSRSGYADFVRALRSPGILP